MELGETDKKEMRCLDGHLFPYGLQISVAYKVFSELHSGQPGAPRV